MRRYALCSRPGNRSLMHSSDALPGELAGVDTKVQVPLPIPSNPVVHSCGLRKRKANKPTKSIPKKACGDHISLARSRQHDTLSAFGCVCKALLARGLQSCCAPRGHFPHSISSSLLNLRSAGKSRSRVSSCCGDKDCHLDEVPRLPPSARNSLGHYASREQFDTLSVTRGSRGSLSSSCDKPCCGQPLANEGADLENHLTEKINDTEANYCVLSVKGMTCTGCENKLIRALRGQSDISNVKTSLVLCRAEFNYGCAPEDLPQLIQRVQKRTGFELEQISAASSAHALEFTTSLAKKLAQNTFPDGVRQSVVVNKNTARVVYDPKIIGARQVLAAYGAYSPTLAPVPQDPALAAGAKHVRLLLLRTILSTILTIPVLVMTWAPLPSHPLGYDIACLILATLVQTAIAGPFYVNAFKSLFFSGLVETDLLIVLSTTTAYVYSVVAFAFEVSGKPLDGGSFFETSTLLVTLIMFGQLASAFARQRAVAAISLRSLQAPSATIILTRPDGSVEEQTIDARLLQYDDVFRVLPDTAVITDGVVFSGVSTVDESMMTGEALPVEKGPGNEVLAGTTNCSGNLLVRVTRLPGENTISDIADMVDDARFSRAKVQGIVDRVCAWFVPSVLLLAIVTFIVWVLVGKYVRGQSGGQAAVPALTYAIAVLAVSCPCAIGLAVPMVVLVASGVAARLGVVFKAAMTIESARSITHVVFDKTGTLTKGQLEVAKEEIAQTTLGDGSTNTSATAVSVLAALALGSKHPVARAVATHLALTGEAASTSVRDIEEVTGKGVQGTLYDKTLVGGSAKWLDLEEHPSVAPILAAGYTTFCVTYDGSLLAVFGLTDTIRPEAPSLLANLRARGAQVSILSGDHAAAVQRVASELNIAASNTQASCLPADKASYIRGLQARGARVLFCGDGTNDSVALAQANIGVHMASEGAAGAAASAASDAVLIRASLEGIGALLTLSDAVYRRIVLNFVWAAVYNSIAVLLAGGAFVNARIPPAYAGLGEIVSVLPVVLIAMQLKWFRG